MAFRKRGANGRKRQQSWYVWIDANARTLKSIGLPPEVYLSLDHWLDFLENGHLHWHLDDSTGFEFGDLSHDQMLHLLRFLESENQFEPGYYPMIGWLRVRTGTEEAS